MHAKPLDMAVRLIKKARLTRLVKRGLPYAPERLQSWARSEAAKRAELVPEQELELKYREALSLLNDRHGPENLGDYLEFGVFHGASLACMHRALQDASMAHVRLFGFDSFEGLPEKEDGDQDLPWEPGEFSADFAFTKAVLTDAGVDWNRVFLVKGWFDETLNERLLQKYGISKASVIMIDCDLYSSSKQALDFCGPLIKDEAIIFFDDWDGGMNLAERGLGERRAFDEFLQRHRDLTATEFGNYYHTEMSPPAESKIFLVSRSRTA